MVDYDACFTARPKDAVYLARPKDAVYLAKSLFGIRGVMQDPPGVNEVKAFIGEWQALCVPYEQV